MRGIKELRVKESDRIDAMARGLEACGIKVEEGQDYLIVHGRGPGGVPGGATVASRLDHRIAMAFLCLGLAAKAPITVDDGGPIATSFPDFVPLMRGLGAEIERVKTGGCLCGAVRYRVDGPLDAGGRLPLHASAGGRAGIMPPPPARAREDVTIEGEVAWYESTPGVIRRGFCPVCGSNLFWDRMAAPKLDIWAGTLDGADRAPARRAHLRGRQGRLLRDRRRAAAGGRARPWPGAPSDLHGGDRRAGGGGQGHDRAGGGGGVRLRASRHRAALPRGRRCRRSTTGAG